MFMTLLTQLCVVVLTLAVIAIAIFAVRVMMRVDELSRQLEGGIEAFRKSANEAGQTAIELRTLLRSVEGVAENVRGVSQRFEGLGNRVLDVASSVVNEVETPMRRTLSLVRGVRAGTSAFVKRWTHRNEYSQHNGGHYDVGREEHV
jgi:uncharacterized protein YoxC